MTIQSKTFQLIESGYYMLDMGYCVLYVVQTATGWLWERLLRNVDGELIDDDSKSGSCKLRHHSATSAIRSARAALVW